MERESLILLDDVWSSEFLEAFVSIAGSAKLLVISQNPNLCEKFEHTGVKIQDITSTDAKRILASHAGLTDNEIPPHLQEVADQLLKMAWNTPLALAMIGKRLYGERSSSLLKWNDLLQSYSNSFTDHLENDEVEGSDVFHGSSNSLTDHVQDNEVEDYDITWASIARRSMRLAFEGLDLHSQQFATLISMCNDL